MVLDGNPLDEEGLGYLCTALLRNRRVETVSLRRCGLGERGGSLLLRLQAEKPGLEVVCAEGNPVGEEMHNKVYRITLLHRSNDCMCSLQRRLNGGVLDRLESP